ncbi:FMN reductase [Salinicoccus sediminis]|uniref:FMN-dependent NADPH-azoreductase n=1 Tax=Salinicoccus sediminis TaxID=1432562 RepID=A0A0M2SMG3_9STAP|nr:NADPH-dependent FMN reductase [Salinicoccus sediminis]KKK33805.1 FMN reductase [Salinicoccus sediminis]
MNIVILSGSVAGSKTRTAMEYVKASFNNNHPEHDTELLNLADLDIQFSDGRNFLDYSGDTGYLTKTLMEADAIVIGTPIFQASIPGALKNVFDLLPQDGFRDKTVSMLATAGSSKHFLIPENQLKPIIGYMKAQMLQSYVFIEERYFANGEITDDDVIFRIDRLAEDTLVLAETYRKIREEKEASYGF